MQKEPKGRKKETYHQSNLVITRQHVENVMSIKRHYEVCFCLSLDNATHDSHDSQLQEKQQTSNIVQEILAGISYKPFLYKPSAYYAHINLHNKVCRVSIKIWTWNPIHTRQLRIYTSNFNAQTKPRYERHSYMVEKYRDDRVLIIRIPKHNFRWKATLSLFSRCGWYRILNSKHQNKGM